MNKIISIQRLQNLWNIGDKNALGVARILGVTETQLLSLIDNLKSLGYYFCPEYKKNEGFLCVACGKRKTKAKNKRCTGCNFYLRRKGLMGGLEEHTLRVEK